MKPQSPLRVYVPPQTLTSLTSMSEGTSGTAMPGSQSSLWCSTRRGQHVIFRISRRQWMRQLRLRPEPCGLLQLPLSLSLRDASVRSQCHGTERRCSGPRVPLPPRTDGSSNTLAPEERRGGPRGRRNVGLPISSLFVASTSLHGTWLIRRSQGPGTVFTGE